MVDDSRCEELSEPLVELALGIASGDDRARVLEHVGGCARCRRQLDQLALTSDELLRLAPEHEPPPGFELRVLSRIGAPQRVPRRRRARLALAFAAVAAVAAALSIAVVLVETRDERRLGAQLSAVLTQANGQYIAVTELYDRGRGQTGLVFHYGGHPSWVFVTFDRAPPAGRYRATLVTKTGAERPLGTFTLDGTDRSYGSTVPFNLLEVAQLRLEAERGGATYVADF